MNKMDFQQQVSSDDWGSSTPSQIWQPRTLHITKENKSIYLIVAGSLAATTLTSVIGIIVLTLFSKEVPGALIALGSVAVGALGSLFTHNK
jgi:putative Ca2+/H+ antiporter (TMEM165/GDT1 family)